MIVKADPGACPFQSLLDLDYRLTIWRNYVGKYTVRIHHGTVPNRLQKPRYDQLQLDGKTPSEALRRLAEKLELEDKK